MDTKSYSDHTKDAFYIYLRKATTTIKSKHPSFKLVVGGDFNATIGKDCESYEKLRVGNNNDPNPTSSNG